MGYEEKTVSEIFRELAASGASFKFTARGSIIRVSIDGLHSSLSSSRARRKIMVVG